jgi:hypothetical protein
VTVVEGGEVGQPDLMLCGLLGQSVSLGIHYPYANLRRLLTPNCRRRSIYIDPRM